MKILVFSQYFYPEYFRVNALCADLAARGHAVTVVTAYPQYPLGKIYDGYGFGVPYEKVWRGVNVVRLKVPPRGSNAVGLLKNTFAYVRQGKKWVKRCKEKFDAVYVFEVSPVTVGLPAVAYGKKFHVPVFFNVQDLWPENVEVVMGVKNKAVLKFIDKIVDKIYAGSDKILCASRSFAENIAARGVDREKLVYWPQFHVKPDFSALKKPECYGENAFNVVFAGNIGDAQGLDLLAETAALMKEDNIFFTVAGDGRARARLEEKIADLGVGDKVRFVGRVSEEEANAYVHYADCAYLSFQDNKLFDMTLPAKMQTYLACGTPVLAAAGGESAAIVREAQCGLVAEHRPEAVAAALRKLAASDLTAMRRNAENYFAEHFTADKLIGDLLKMMEKKYIRR
ncbi:MAG: glycosyltransferase WbuB [Bacillota bacterium]|nr:MAG: glycosyltransferase WbuB [Bacillota bacterium]